MCFSNTQPWLILQVFPLHTCDEEHGLLVRVDLHLARDPFAVEVREPPALLLVVVIAVLVGRSHERDAEVALRRLALPLRPAALTRRQGRS